MLLLKNAHLVDARGERQGHLVIHQGKINIIEDPEEYKDAISINLEGLTLMPSFCDTHVHFRDPGFTYKENLETGSRSALAGGYTTVNLMGNTKPICDNADVYEDIMARGKALELIDIHQVMAITKGFDGKNLLDFSSLPSSVRCLSDDGKGILSNHTMYHACKAAKEHDLTLMIHAEDPDLSAEDYRAAEDLITIRDVYLSGYFGTKVHMSHVSTIGAMEAIIEAKKKNYPVTCEVSPHHLVLYDEDYRVNPPIRGMDDVKYLVQAVKTGFVDCIATDHAPHSEEDKEKGAPGMIGLETAFSLCYTYLVKKQNLPLSRLSQLMSLGGLQVLGVENRGLIEDGYDAHLVVVDLEKTYTIDANSMASKSKNTPFHGMEVQGQVMMTLVGENILYRREE